jgi:uncharacterized protein (TIGR02147 family)
MARLVGPDVFAYSSYREYLRAFYGQKKRERAFSYRAFSQRARLRSPNYLKLVIDGDRNLSAPMAERFADACDLSGEALAYFKELVAFEQASTLEAQNQCHVRLQAFRRYREMHRLELAHDAYHSRWYLPAIRELAVRDDFSADPDWLAGILTPKIKPSEAKWALETLLELGLLEVGPEGRVRQGHGLVTTGAETTSRHVANFHLSMMERAAEALDLSSELRDISSVTVCVGASGMRELKQVLQRFRRELLELSEREPKPKQVVQINLQAFPLSRVEMGKGDA